MANAVFLSGFLGIRLSCVAHTWGEDHGLAGNGTTRNARWRLKKRDYEVVTKTTLTASRSHLDEGCLVCGSPRVNFFLILHPASLKFRLAWANIAKGTELVGAIGRYSG